MRCALFRAKNTRNLASLAQDELEEEEEDYDEPSAKKPKNRFVIEEAGKFLKWVSFRI